jgi:trans-aconitate methyltransferase
MLKSYEAIYKNGVLQWLDSHPEVNEARVIVTVLPPEMTIIEPMPKKRQPPEKLKGTARAVGDIVSSPCAEEEWEAMFDRTARQLAGNPEAFK